MKWSSQVLTWIYIAGSLYFLYLAAMGIFVYVANKSMGHYESFLGPGRNLVCSVLLGVFAYGGWVWIKNPETYKLGMAITYFPVIVSMLVLLWFLIIIVSGARWN